jgi:hypothetical protein
MVQQKLQVCLDELHAMKGGAAADETIAPPESGSSIS